MSEQSHSAHQQTSGAEGSIAGTDKGKGKAVDLPAQDMDLDDDDESSGEEEDVG